MPNYRLYTLKFADNATKQFVDANYCDFYNQGTTNVYVNGRTIFPGAGFSVAAYPGEVDQTNYEIVFDTSNLAGNNLLVTIKQYI